MGTKITHRYTFHPCSDPQAVGLFLEVGEHVYDMSFQESKMVSLNMTTTLNFTLLHPSKTTVGLAVNHNMLADYISFSFFAHNTNYRAFRNEKLLNKKVANLST